jgi:hypothetical protein
MTRFYISTPTPDEFNQAIKILDEFGLRAFLSEPQFVPEIFVSITHESGWWFTENSAKRVIRLNPNTLTIVVDNLRTALQLSML